MRLRIRKKKIMKKIMKFIIGILKPTAEKIASWFGIGYDKVMHAEVGIVLALAGYFASFYFLKVLSDDLLGRMFVSTAFGILLVGYLSLGKEIRDQREPDNAFSSADIEYAFYAGVITLVINNIVIALINFL